MHPKSGQRALEQAGLTAGFKRVARHEDQQSKVHDKHGALRFSDTEVAGKVRPKVDRGQLRQYEAEVFASAEIAATQAGEAVGEVFADDGLSYLLEAMERQHG